MTGDFAPQMTEMVDKMIQWGVWGLIVGVGLLLIRLSWRLLVILLASTERAVDDRTESSRRLREEHRRAFPDRDPDDWRSAPLDLTKRPRS